jgi:hypothetical protein
VQGELAGARGRQQPRRRQQRGSVPEPLTVDAGPSPFPAAPGWVPTPVPPGCPAR